MTADMTAARTRLAIDLTSGLDLSDAARKLLAPDVTAAAYFDALVQAGLSLDGIRYIAWVFPKPMAVWWGCLCAWHAGRDPAAPETRVLGAVVAWLRDPTDANRQACGREAKRVGPNTPAALVATAAFLSGGSISPAEKPAVAPDPSFTPKCVANAVLAASRKGDSAGAAVRRHAFLALAVDVFRGKNSWMPPAPTASGSGIMKPGSGVTKVPPAPPASGIIAKGPAARPKP